MKRESMSGFATLLINEKQVPYIIRPPKDMYQKKKDML
jgi:hypothetical protein